MRRILFNIKTEYVINKRGSSLFASMDYSSKGRVINDNNDNISNRDFK